MAAYYPKFELCRFNSSNLRITMSATTITAWNITAGGTSLGSVASDSNGFVAQGTFAVSPGTIIEFRSGTYGLTVRFTLAESYSTAYSIGNPSVYVLENLYTTSKTSKAVDFYALDLDNPNVEPVLLGSGRSGQTALIPYQTNVDKNLRIIPVPRELRSQSRGRLNFSTSNYEDIVIPGLTSSGLTIGDAITGGTAKRLLTSGTVLGETPTLGAFQAARINEAQTAFEAFDPARTIFDFKASRTNLTGNDSIFSYYVPGDTLKHNGDKLLVKAFLTTGSDANDKELTISFAGSTPYDYFTTGSGGVSKSVRIDMMITRVSSTALYVHWTTNINSVTDMGAGTITGTDLTTAQLFDVTASSDAVSQWTLTHITALLLPAAAVAVPTTSLWAYYEADYFDDVYSDGDNITISWQDSSGNGRHAAVTNTPTLETNELNGQPVVRLGFNSNDYFTPPSMSGFTAGEIFIVEKITDITVNGGHKFGNTTEGYYPYNTGSPSDIYDEFGTSTRKGPLTSLLTILNTWHVYNAWSATNDWSLNQNGCLVSHTGSNTVAFSSVPRIGFNGSAGYIKGDIAGVYIFNAKLSASDRAKMHAYISNKYAI